MDTNKRLAKVIAWVTHEIFQWRGSFLGRPQSNFISHALHSTVSTTRQRKVIFVAAVLVWFAPTLTWNHDHLTLSLTEAHADSISYVYDSLGRVVQALNITTAETVIYSYDAAGNITSQNTTSGSLAISNFNPTKGAVGAVVTISGTGFSATTSADTVQFNGTAATVTSASTTQLVASVPSGATTGFISVTVGSATVTSTQSFTVASSAGAPTISSTSPSSGAAGTTVTLTGTNFLATLNLDKVLFNGTTATITSATPTSLTAIVPINVASGPIQVSTPFGSATSSGDFIVPPNGYSASDVVATGRTTENGSTLSLNASVASKPVIALFNGTQGEQYVRVVINASAGNASVQVLDPSAKVIATQTLSSSTIGFVDLQNLSKSGTYSVVANPGAQTEQVGITVSNATKKGLELTWKDGSNTMYSSVAGQRNVFNFVGGPNERLTLYINSSSTGATTWNGYPKFLLVDPAGNTVWQAPITTGLSVYSLSALASSGSFTLISDPGPYRLDFAFAGGIGALLTPDAAPTFLGQFPGVGKDLYSRAWFQGTAGQTITLHATHASGYSGYLPVVSARLCYGDYYADSRNCTAFASEIFYDSLAADYSVQVKSLPYTGKYYFEIGPNRQDNPMNIQLLSAPGGTISTNSSLSLTIPNTGQMGKVTFAGGANGYVGLNFQPGAPQSLSYAMIYMTGPSGNVVYSTGNYNGYVDLLSGLTMSLVTPTTGQYTVYVVPARVLYYINGTPWPNSQSSLDASPYSQGSATVTVSTPVTGSMSIGGASVPITTTLRGQNARYTFSHAGSQNTTFTATNVSSCGAAVRMYAPGESGTSTHNGMALNGKTISSSGTTTITFLTSQTGTYILEFAAPGGCTMSLTGKLN